jgi:hypothetical protein
MLCFISIFGMCDSPPSYVGSHILRTLDNGKMGLVLSRLVILQHTWVEAHKLGNAPQRLFSKRMEDISFGGTLASLKDDIAPFYMAFGGL